MSIMWTSDKDKRVDADLCHDTIIRNLTPELSYNPKNDYNEWKKQIKDKFYELTGLNRIAKNATTDFNVKIEKEEDKGDYRQIRFYFDSEIGETVPCYILIPKGEKKKYPGRAGGELPQAPGAAYIITKWM